MNIKKILLAVLAFTLLFVPAISMAENPTAQDDPFSESVPDFGQAQPQQTSAGTPDKKKAGGGGTKGKGKGKGKDKDEEGDEEYVTSEQIAEIKKDIELLNSIWFRITTFGILGLDIVVLAFFFWYFRRRTAVVAGAAIRANQQADRAHNRIDQITGEGQPTPQPGPRQAA